MGQYGIIPVLKEVAIWDTCHLLPCSVPLPHADWLLWPPDVLPPALAVEAWWPPFGLGPVGLVGRGVKIFIPSLFSFLQGPGILLKPKYVPYIPWLQGFPLLSGAYGVYYQFYF